jgi:peptidoglycan/xylan/chitin deacetylase (PgdA/CDA1 family)
MDFPSGSCYSLLMVFRPSMILACVVLAGCSAFGHARQSAPGPDSEASSKGGDILEAKSLKTLIRTGMHVESRPWASSFDCGEKTVYLTFDDGPKPHRTEKVLDALDEKGVKGTFFLIGRKAEEHPGLVREIAGRGHTVGSHTYSHMIPWGKNRKRYVANALEGRRVLEEILGREVPLMRPPGGNLRLIDELEKNGMKVVLWTTLSGDCRSGKPPLYLLSLIRMQHEKRPMFHYPMIILMHDTNIRTAQALPRIIDYLKSRGYRFLSEWS